MVGLDGDEVSHGIPNGQTDHKNPKEPKIQDMSHEKKDSIIFH